METQIRFHIRDLILRRLIVMILIKINMDFE